MLKKHEKLEKRDDFLKSNQFGTDAYISLFTFRHNTLGFLSTTQFYYDLLTKIDDPSIFKHAMKNQQIIETKQRIILDMITKAINISEGLFILIKSLNEGYSVLAKNMVEYRTSDVQKTISHIRKNELNLKQILAFPNFDKLELSNDEKEFLELISKDTVEKISQKLNSICNFYQQYNIIYNKTKHGMTIYPAGFLSGKPETLENSSLTALDHRDNKNSLPPGYFESQIRAIEKRWFNVKSHLNFNEKFFKELSNVLIDLQYLSDYIVSNHFTFVNNCGENYIPFKIMNEKQAVMWFNSKQIHKSENEQTIISIQEKIFPYLLGSPLKFNINDQYGDTILSKIIPENSITNIWLQDEPLQKPKN